MTDTDVELEALRQEWLARQQAATTKRTAARLTAADAAFRAYTARRSGLPAPRSAADALEGSPGRAPVGGRSARRRQRG
jgi:hypothetical protein